MNEPEVYEITVPCNDCKRYSEHCVYGQPTEQECGKTVYTIAVVPKSDYDALAEKVKVLERALELACDMLDCLNCNAPPFCHYCVGCANMTGESSNSFLQKAVAEIAAESEGKE